MNYRSTCYSHLVTLPVGRRRPSRVFEPLPQDKVTCMEIVGTAACSPLSLFDCSLLTPFIVSRSRIQVCGLLKDVVPRFPPKNIQTSETVILTLKNISVIVFLFPRDFYFFPFSVAPSKTYARALIKIMEKL